MVTFFDVWENISFFPESKYFEQDGLHMSKEGYSKLGTLLAPIVNDCFFNNE